MLFRVLLFVHVCGAVVGMLSGVLAVLLRKGSGPHGAAGTVFFVSMIGMSTSAAYLAVFFKPVPINAVVGLLTFYLVVTAWRAARRRENKPDLFDLAALLFILADGLAAWGLGIRTANSAAPPPGGIPAPAYFIFGTVALLCAASDVRMFVRGGARRIARHLWRMSLALLIALLSFYPGQARILPQWLRDTNLLMTPHLLVIGSLIFHALRHKRGFSWTAQERNRRQLSSNVPPSSALSPSR